MQYTNDEIEIADIGKLISNPGRIRILSILINSKPLTSTQITDLLPLKRTTVIQHLNVLKDGGLLKTATDGSSIMYLVNSDMLNKYFNKINSFISLFSTLDITQSNKRRINVLFLCSGNSTRSQIAEAFLNKYGEKFNIHGTSAGIKPKKQVNPMVIKVMNEIGIDMGTKTTTDLDDIKNRQNFDFVIFVCSKDEIDCPFHFPFVQSKIYMPFTNPRTFEQADELENYRKLRNDIEVKIIKIIEELNEGDNYE